MLLDAVTKSLTLVTEQAISTDWSVEWADITTTAFTPGDNAGNVSAVTTTTIVAAPVAATQRKVNEITVRNAGSSAQIVTVYKVVSGTSYAVSPDIELAAGETLQYVKEKGWSVLDPFGQLKMLTDIDSIINDVTVTGIEGIREAIGATNKLLLMQMKRPRPAKVSW